MSGKGVLRLQRDALSMVKRRRQASIEYDTFSGGGLGHRGWRPLATALKITSRTT